jgi:hypothetical protein
MAWKRGPLPPGTYHWGGVILVGEDTSLGAFHFADFAGDHVKISSGRGPKRIVQPNEVAFYNNCLELFDPKKLPGGKSDEKKTDPTLETDPQPSDYPGHPDYGPCCG